jgi:hypothetical protein
MLKQGVNTATYDTGIVLGENATNLIYADATYAYINGVAKPVRNKVESGGTVYENGVPDSNWTFIQSYNSERGNGYWQCPIANYDPSATYTVDYEILDTIAPQIGTAEATYSEGLVDSVSALYGMMETKQEQDVSLDTYVNLSIYEKTSANKKCVVSWDFNTPKLSITFTIPVVKKLSPTPFITQDTLTISKGNGAVNVTSLFVLESRVYSDEQVIITYSTTDATTITDIKANGVTVVGSVTVDCRGRL